jgi:type III restriction enzyme
MATGSGNEVMSMLITWTFCNRGRMPADERFPNAVLEVCPNLTIFERLQVLRTDTDDNYYQQFDIVPAQLMPELQKSKVLISNWHKFAPESPHVESGKSYVVVDKGEKLDAFARRVPDLHDRALIMVLNDRRTTRIGQSRSRLATASVEEKRARKDSLGVGADRINAACGVKFVVDLPATPFYLGGSGYRRFTLPWLVSISVWTIESGIVKIPRLLVSDTTGRPSFCLGIHRRRHAARNCPAASQAGGGVGRRRAADLAGQWKERASYLQGAARPGTGAAGDDHRAITRTRQPSTRIFPARSRWKLWKTPMKTRMTMNLRQRRKRRPRRGQCSALA